MTQQPLQPERLTSLMESATVDPMRAKSRFLQLVRSGLLDSEQIGKAIASWLMVDDPKLAIELLPQASFNSKRERLLIAKRVSRQTGVLRLQVLHYLRYHAHNFLVQPSMYFDSFKSIGSLRAKSAYRQAVRQYPSVLAMLKKSMRGKRVLLLGSGPSVKSVTWIPDDVVVVGINRSPAHLATLNRQGGDLIWSLNNEIGTYYWDHFQEIAAKLRSVKVVLLKYSLGGKRWDAASNPMTWNSLLRRKRCPFPTAFLPIEDLEGTKSIGYDLSRYRHGNAFTNGMNMLRFILSTEPAEVYLAGMDLGYAGRSESGFPYFHRSDEFLNVDGLELKSGQRAEHPLDEMLMADMSKRKFPIFTVSSDSQSADHFPVKALRERVA